MQRKGVRGSALAGSVRATRLACWSVYAPEQAESIDLGAHVTRSTSDWLVGVCSREIPPRNSSSRNAFLSVRSSARVFCATEEVPQLAYQKPALMTLSRRQVISSVHLLSSFSLSCFYVP